MINAYSDNNIHNATAALHRVLVAAAATHYADDDRWVAGYSEGVEHALATLLGSGETAKRFVSVLLFEHLRLRVHTEFGIAVDNGGVDLVASENEARRRAAETGETAVFRYTPIESEFTPLPDRQPAPGEAARADLDQAALGMAGMAFINSPERTNARRTRDAIIAYLYSVANTHPFGTGVAYPSWDEVRRHLEEFRHV